MRARNIPLFRGPYPEGQPELRFDANEDALEPR